jgi:hypothetical protein
MALTQNPELMPSATDRRLVLTQCAGEFHRETLEAVESCHNFAYNPQYWVGKVADYGAVGGAKGLLLGRKPSEGFTRLWEEGRLDLSVEFMVLLPKYVELFTTAERQEARRRLLAHNFDVNAALAKRARLERRSATARPPTPSEERDISSQS